MYNQEFKKCTCPKCNTVGRSVAAMNYSETRVWDKSGYFSGSGVGVGTGGIGLGFGSGSYYETGQSSTKRARVFDEPQPFRLPVIETLIGITILGSLVYLAPDVGSFLGNILGYPSDSGISQDGVASIQKPLTIFASIVGVAITMYAPVKALQIKDEEDKVNSVLYPEMLDRYNELHYCECCHILYDNAGSYQNANTLGFSTMMDTIQSYRQ